MNPDPNKPMDEGAENKFWRRLRLDMLPDELERETLEERGETGGEIPLSPDKIAEMVARATGKSDVVEDPAVEDDEGAPPIHSFFAWAQRLNRLAAAGIAAALLLSAGIVIYQIVWKTAERKIEDFAVSGQILVEPAGWSDEDRRTALSRVQVGVAGIAEYIRDYGTGDLLPAADEVLGVLYSQLDSRGLVVNPEPPEGEDIAALTDILIDPNAPLVDRIDAIRRMGEEARRGLTCLIVYSQGPLPEEVQAEIGRFYAGLERWR